MATYIAIKSEQTTINRIEKKFKKEAGIDYIYKSKKTSGYNPNDTRVDTNDLQVYPFFRLSAY